MSGTAYDRMLSGFSNLDSMTLTCHAVKAGYIPDTAHVDLTDIDPGDVIASDTAAASLTMAAGEAVLDVADVEIDLGGDTAVAWIVWTDVSDLLVCYEPGPTGAAADPLEVSYASGLLRGSRG